MTLAIQGDDQARVRAAEERWRNEGVPFVSVKLNTAAQLGAGVFKWEVATALACAQLGINPFDEPDTLIGKEGHRKLWRTLRHTASCRRER